MPTFGSDGGFQADNRGGVIDDQGNTIVSSDTEFASSPLGVAARTQALYGIPNANFNLVPPTPSSPIVANQNDLPYWSIEDLSGGLITATTVFDSTTQTWGVELNPGTAVNGSSLSLSTRSYLITDDNLALRQKALAVLSKSGTAAVSTQWNLTLSAIYYNANDSALSTAFIGTALDTGTWTSFSGTTTPGGSAINAAAQYVDLTFTLTTTADVTGSAKATIKSLLLQTSSATSGNFLVAETFTSNATWNRPINVTNLVAAVAAGGGGGGGGGQLIADTSLTRTFKGASGGAGGNWWIIKDLYVGDQSSISIGIGAGGAGGTAQTFTKAAAGTAEASLNGANGSTGGNTTIGSYVTVYGGGAGLGAVVSGSSGANGGTAGAAPTTSVWLGSAITAGTGGVAGLSNAAAGNGAAGGFSGYTLIPYSPLSASGSSGGTGSSSGATQTVGAVGTSTSGWLGGGGGSGGGTASSSGNAVGASGSGSLGGGGGGGSRAIWGGTAAITISGTAGDGGAGTNAAGGGGGGSLVLAMNSSGYSGSTLTFASGAGGAGANGFVTLVYIA